MAITRRMPARKKFTKSRSGTHTDLS
jgi:hypothetical protein